MKCYLPICNFNGDLRYFLSHPGLGLGRSRADVGGADHLRQIHETFAALFLLVLVDVQRCASHLAADDGVVQCRLVSVPPRPQLMTKTPSFILPSASAPMM